MQSQQKRLKWSRGETAEALEERTDTGITQASVEIMENCIPDIYGNVSRRPALKILPWKTNNYYWHINYDPYMQIIPFYITENDYIIIVIHGDGTATESLRIKNNEVVYRGTFSGTGDINFFSNVFHEDLADGTVTRHPLSYTQQNNFLLIASETRMIKVSIENYLTSDSYNLVYEYWDFVAGWYAPEGTKTKKVDNTTQVVVSGTTVTLSDLEFNHGGAGFSTYIGQDGIGSVCYSTINTGLTNNTTNINAISIAIPVGSIVQFPKNGAYMRVEGYHGNTDNNKVYIQGPLLTPVVDDSQKDTSVVVEYGYTRLNPVITSGISPTTYYPHPLQLLFLDQRLWAGDWLYGATLESTGSYSLVVGSQIAKYNDFKNDYNQENEAITLDILTQYKERILHLVDYNGLKIMTDSFEYAYEGGAVIKQSGNGSLRDCKPIVFESLCLYVDSTGNQVKAMQYEFQANIFNSSTINTVAPHDLVWFPYCMAAYEDKVNSTGKYLFLVNKDEADHPRLAVCNFVPSNQANIWNRWSVAATVYTEYIDNPDHLLTPIDYTINDHTPIIHSVVNLKDGVLFFVTCKLQHAELLTSQDSVVVPAMLDFTGKTDLEGIAYDNYGHPYYSIATYSDGTFDHILTINDADIAVYDGDEFKFMTKTDTHGKIEADLTGISNPAIGIPINATIRSHPIDVGGKTKSVKKRIGKAQVSVHDTEPGAITINGKTGYMNPQHDHICFYGVTGMKDEVKYTITNKNGAMFHLESLLMNIEYGTLDS